MALFHVSHPPARLVGAEDFLYSRTPQVLDPLQTPLWGTLTAPHYIASISRGREVDI